MSKNQTPSEAYSLEYFIEYDHTGWETYTLEDHENDETRQAIIDTAQRWRVTNNQTGRSLKAKITNAGELKTVLLCLVWGPVWWARKCREGSDA